MGGDKEPWKHVEDKSPLSLRECDCVVLIFVAILKHSLCASHPGLSALVKSIWIAIISSVFLRLLLGPVKSLFLDLGLALFLWPVPGFWQRGLELMIHLGNSLGVTL